MGMPRDFGFGEEAQMLRDSARRFFEKNLPAERLHRLVAGDPDPHRQPACNWDADLWRQICELGWTTLAVPERAGGLGMPWVAVAALAEENGRAAFPSPLLGTLQASRLLDSCASAEADAVLARIAEGASATIALCDRRGSWHGDGCDLRADSGRLNGTAFYVQDAAKAELLLVRAGTDEGGALYLVSTAASGLRVVPDSIVDLTRDQSCIEFDNVAPEAMVAAPGAADAAIAAAEPAFLTLLAADMCGAGERLLQITVEYATIRRQFDRPIGFFQAVKHPLVDFMIDIDMARSHTYNAACAIDHAPQAAERAARMAKAAASEMAVFGAGRAVQLHGGIGFTWECNVHLWFKRQMHTQALFGDAAYQRSLLAEMLIGPPRTA